MLRRFGVLRRSGVVCRGYDTRPSVPNNIAKLVDARLENSGLKRTKCDARTLSKTKNENGKRPARSFNDIVNDMNARKLEEDEMVLAKRDRVRRLSFTVGTKKRTTYLDMTSGLKVGDLVQSQRNGISVIIGIPNGKSSGEEITICTISGTVKQVRKRDIALKLENFAPAELFEDATCDITSGNGQPMTVLKSDVRLAVCGPLREFYRDAHAQAPAVRKALEDILTHFSKPDKPLAIPFFELCRIVQYVTFMSSQNPEQCKDPNFYADLLAEDYPLPRSTSKLHETVSPKILYVTYLMIELVFNNRALLDINTVTVLSQRSVDMANSALRHIKRKEVVDKINDMMDSHMPVSELEHDQAGVSTMVEEVLTFLKRYALRDFNDLDSISHSAAISLLRHLGPFERDYITFETALAVQTQLKNLDEYHGPQIESERFAVITNEFNSTLHPASMIEKYPDSMEAIRSKDSAERSIYCIDASDAEEIDDGISIIRDENTGKWKLGVHIADPASALMAGDGELNRILNRAYRLCSTAYMPQESVPMLPSEFKQAFGLIKDTAAPRRCLSFEFDYDPQRGEIDEESIQVKPHLVNNIVSLTYYQVDQMLKEPRTSSPRHADLHDLHSVGGCFREFRRMNGALDIDIQSYSARVQEDCDDVELIENKLLESSKVVSEMMIMANYLTAGFTRNNAIPNIYRSQILNYTKAAPSAARMKMATLSAVPFAHESLGLKYYTNVTSPLRRFQDLIGHWQLEAYLSNNKYTLLDRTQMFTMATWLHSNQSTINQAERQSNAYWKLRKIDSLPRDPEPLFDCILIRNIPRIDGSQMAYCTSWGMDAVVHGLPNDIATNDTFQCSLRSVHPTQYKLELQFQSKN
ncbi:hypothetical protein TRICI_004192 [Trichomonascus ciferrii]|uniref:RNB domain-containing protein n=1 Tax=Trichomonascus ciferrii TaxID=44093 RepID=A0A642V6V9_9ASCO|nr:hypothetical protein TRICI_004192 [Trichomonascus ciferrii]